MGTSVSNMPQKRKRRRASQVRKRKKTKCFVPKHASQCFARPRTQWILNVLDVGHTSWLDNKLVPEINFDELKLDMVKLAANKKEETRDVE